MTPENPKLRGRESSQSTWYRYYAGFSENFARSALQSARLGDGEWVLDPWNGSGTINGNEQLGEAYRRCCTSVSWVGEALTIHLMHAESTWNYPAFFDYVDRWMTEDDSQAVAEIKAQTGFDYSANWDRQGQTRYWLQGEFPQYTFIDDMWAAYRQ